MRNLISGLMTSFFICFALLGPAFALAEFGSISPEIAAVEPKEISSGMSIRIKGYRLGANDRDLVKIIFLQHSKEYAATLNGSSWTSANVSQGPQYLEVYTPEQVVGGKCDLIVEYKGQRSSPYSINVLPVHQPPQIFKIRPQIVNPNEYINIEGTGFNTTDSAELVHSNGTNYKLTNAGNPDPDLNHFRLPKDFPEGVVTLRVIENRSGLNQSSNSLTFKVTRGLVPLEVLPADIDSVAAGQWTWLTYWTEEILRQATKVELKVRQGRVEKTIFIKDPKIMAIQIPRSFTPGSFTVQNRVWKNNEVSEWSSPITIEIASKPKEPIIYRYSKMPEKAEALFRQNNKVLKVSPIFYDINARAKLPGEIGPGKLEIFSRVLKAGIWTAWKFENSISELDRDFISANRQSLHISSFDNYFPIGIESPEFFQIERGEILRINGAFYEKSSRYIRLNLSRNGEIISLKPKKNLLWDLFFFKIPTNISQGDWEVSLTNRKTRTVTNISVKLRIN